MNAFHILVIDDDVEWLEPFVENLQEVPVNELTGRSYEGVDIEVATNQQDADRSLAQKGKNYFGLVLLDLKYPVAPEVALDENSFQGMKWLPNLRRTQPKAAIVVLSAYAHGNELRDAIIAVRDYHADDFVPKTAALEEVVSRIRSACENIRRKQKQIVLQKELVSLARGRAARAYAEDVASLIHNARASFNRFARKLETGDASAIAETPDVIRTGVQAIVNEFDALTEMMYHRIGLGSKDKEEFNVAELVREALYAYEPWLEEAGIILVSPPNEQMVIQKSYKDDLRLALHETISNALESLETSLKPPCERKLTVTVKKEEEGCVTINVVDNGDGISDAAMEHLFESGYTSRKGADHQGIGLYVAKRMMGAVGGDISIRNRQEGGTEVELLVRNLV